MTTTTTAVPAQQPAARSAQFAPIPFGRLLKVEWSKGVGTRSARWLIGLTAAMTLAMMAIPLGFPDDIDQTRTSYLTFAAFGVAVLLPVVGVLMLTTEWTQRTVLVTFTLEPRRGRVLAAKLAAGMLLGLAGSVFALAVAFASSGLATGALGRDVTNPDGLAPLLGFVPFVLLNMLWGMAFGAVLHNTAAAVTLLFVLPTVWNAIAVGTLDKVGEWLDPSQGVSWLLEGTVDDHAGQFVTSMSLWILLPLVGGLYRTVRREVS